MFAGRLSIFMGGQSQRVFRIAKEIQQSNIEILSQLGLQKPKCFGNLAA